jgi:hypothetical protein
VCGGRSLVASKSCVLWLRKIMCVLWLRQFVTDGLAGDGESLDGKRLGCDGARDATGPVIDDNGCRRVKSWYRHALAFLTWICCIDPLRKRHAVELTVMYRCEKVWCADSVATHGPSSVQCTPLAQQQPRRGALASSTPP